MKSGHDGRDMAGWEAQEVARIDAGAPRCSSGKRAWQRRREAKRAMRRYQTQGADVVQPYRCRECGWWHLTSQR